MYRDTSSVDCAPRELTHARYQVKDDKGFYFVNVLCYNWVFWCASKRKVFTSFIVILI